ncbi:MAG: TraB/GumN family protein, partial [Bacteroidota bacterium]
MKNLWILFSLLFWQVGLMQAQVDSPVLENTTQKTASTTAKSLLWEISGKDLQKPSYLYGTIHMIGKEDFFLPDSTESTFARSEKVVFEINMQEMSDLSVIFTLIGKIMM